MRTVARAFHEQGYHVLTPDARAHGESEGSLISLGWNERKDLLRWIDAVLEMDSQAEIVLYGISMGADTILFCPQENCLPQYAVSLKTADTPRCMIYYHGR